MSWFDLTSLIGGFLLALSLIVLGIFLLRHKQKNKGLLFLLLGICAILLMIAAATQP